MAAPRARLDVIAIDTNLLVYAHRAAVPEHRAARGAIERAAADPRGWGIALPTLAELWMVVTHPSCAGGPSRGEQVEAFVRELRTGGGMQVYAPGLSFAERLIRLAAELCVHGPRIFDVQIGLVAQDGGATEIWTRDRRFTGPPGLRVVDPLE